MDTQLFNQMISNGGLESYRKSRTILLPLASFLSLFIPFILTLSYCYLKVSSAGTNIGYAILILCASYFLSIFIFNKILNSGYKKNPEKWQKAFLFEKKNELERCILALDNARKIKAEEDKKKIDQFNESIKEIDNYLNNKKTK